MTLGRPIRPSALRCYAGSGGRCWQPRADEVDGQIRELTTIRDEVRHASVCPAADHMACPTFRRLMGRTVFRAATGSQGDPERTRERNAA